MSMGDVIRRHNSAFFMRFYHSTRSFLCLLFFWYLCMNREQGVFDSVTFDA
jgi:hypothetical protein